MFFWLLLGFVVGVIVGVVCIIYYFSSLFEDDEWKTFVDALEERYKYKEDLKE
jgi:hypothetical protein